MVQFEGSFVADDYSALVALIDAWLGAPSVKMRTFGEEIVYSDGSVYLYCQRAMSNRGPQDEFLVEGTITGDLAAVRLLFGQLSDLCRSRGIGCELVCTQVDSGGEPVGEAFEVQGLPTGED